ncbi:MAG: DUF2273 domain-containing protein [Clostridia bacterium]|nr:DUF2273 domain-containing protein [Clostridia bacterium]
MNENDPKNFAWYVKEFKGAIIGGLIALLFIATGLSKLVIGLAVIALGVFLGYYVQNNKEKVKEVLRNFIDKF